jgi:FAD/FMN-containing dehydrogenase
MNAVAERRRTPANVALGPTSVIQPTSPSEIVEVLVNPKRFPSPVRPMGAGSSVTRCVTANSGTLLDLSLMNRVLKITPDSVTVQPGIRLYELAETLANEGLELVGGFEFANRTAGGAVCGAGMEASMAGDVSQFAGHATQLKVIGPQGKRFVVTENTKSLLALMRLSYGLLGVVYEITLRVRPVQGFSVRAGKVSFKDFAKLGTRLGAAAAGVKLHLLPFSDVVFFELRERAAAAKGASYASRLKDWAVYSAMPTVARSLAHALPVATLRYPLIDKLSAATQSLSSMKSMQAGSNAAEQSGRYRALVAEHFTHCTWAFPVAEISNVVLAYKLFCKEHYTRTGYRCDLPAVGFRLGRDRTALLSPSFESAVLTLTSLSTQEAGWDDFVLDLAEFAAAHGGIPMLNQTRNAAPEHLAKCYGTRLKFFNKVRQELDPHDRLLNQFFATYLTGLA